MYIFEKIIIGNDGIIQKASVSINKLADGYRLPTSDEWKYACYGGSNTTYFWGEDDTEEIVNTYTWNRKNSNNTLPQLGLKKPNKFDIYDLKGPVWEWCTNYTTSQSNQLDDIVDGKTTMCQRGMNYNNDVSAMRVNFMTGQSPSTRATDFGIRVIRKK